jgi:serine/threonine-protein kinase
MTKMVIAERYQVLAPLAQGGMGEIFRAQHLETGRVVALKVIREELAPFDDHEIWLERFRREARIIGTLDTPHVVQILDAGRDAQKQMPFIAMELLNGCDLRSVLGQTSKLKESLALRIVGQACRGLAVTHQAGVVHRDIKPGNLFLSESAEGSVVVKVLDFGIAKIKQESLGEDLTRTGTHLGTPRYMSPEQAQGLGNIDARADVWALGVVLYRALSGATPFPEVRSPGQLVVAISTQDAPSLKERAPQVSDAAHELVHRALARRPKARFANAQEMLDAIYAITGSDLTISRFDVDPAPEPDPGSARQEETRAAVELLLPASDASIAASAAPAGTAGEKTGSARRGWFVAAGTGVALFVAAAAFATMSSDARTASLQRLTLPTAQARASVEGPKPEPEQASAETHVEIRPADALVRVDGVPATVTDGKLRLRGELGAVRTLTLSHQGVDKTFRVVLSAAGAVPSRVEWAMQRPAVPNNPAAEATSSQAPKSKGLTPAEVKDW